MSDSCKLYIAGMVPNGCMYTTGVGPLPYGVWATGESLILDIYNASINPVTDDYVWTADVEDARAAKVIASRSLVGEVGVKA